MRRLMVTLCLCALTACGVVGGGESVAPTATATTATVPPGPAATAASTTRAPSATAATMLPGPPPDESGRDRSIVGLALEPGDSRAGRFRLDPGPNSGTLMPITGRYWRLEDGTMYTVLDVDTAVIADRMAVLVDLVAADGGQAPDSAYLESLRGHYRGDQYQIGLAALVRSLALGGLPTEWAEQWAWMSAIDGTEPPELSSCREASAALDRAARGWIDALDIDLTGGAWTFPVPAFEAALAAEIDEASVCELFIELPGPSPEIVLVAGGGYERFVDVMVDDGTYADAEPELMFRVTAWADETVGPPPDDLDPASLFTLGASYLVAISVCGELPWIYSDFMAGNAYYAPDEPGYEGPTVFSSAWYCDDQVPADVRAG